MTQAESSHEQVCWEIQVFLFNNSATFTQIVESCNAAKATVNKYLDELVDEGKIILKPKRRRGESKYALSDESTEEIKLLLEKQKIKTEIDQMSPKKFQGFKKLLVFLAKSNEGEAFYLSLPDADHPETIKKFKNVGTKILVQD